MKLILEYIKKYKFTYIGIIIIFIVGIIIGVIVSFKTPDSDKEEIREYIEEIISEIEENKQNIFLKTFIQNSKFSLIVFFLGCTIIASFTIYALMIYKGFLIGYITSLLINIFGLSQGFEYSARLLLIQNILFLPIVFLLATSGIRLCKGIIKKDIDLKYGLLRHFVILVINLIVGVILSCLEAYFII